MGAAPKVAYWNMVAFMSLITCGPGLLSLPLSVSRAGLLPSLAVSVLMAASMIWTMQLVYGCKARCEAAGARIVTYQDLGTELLGGARRVVEVSICLQQFGTLCVYFSFMITILERLLPTVFEGARDVAWSAVLLGPVSIECCLSYLRELGSLATVTMVVFFASWLITMYVCAARIANLGERNARLQHRGWAIVGVYAGWCYAFEGFASMVPQAADSLETPGRVRELLATAIGAVSVVYVITEYLGALAFQHPDDPVTLSLVDQYGKGAVYSGVNFALVATVFAKYPLLFFPFISIVERNLGFGPGARLEDREPLLSEEQKKIETVFISRSDGGTSTVAFRAFLVFLTALIAWLVADLTLLIDLTGILFQPLNSTIFPCIMHFVANDRFGPVDTPMTPYDDAITRCVLVLSVCTWSIGSASMILKACTSL